LSGQTNRTSVIYLHGFASGPGSTKAQFFKTKFEQRGLDVFLPDLNVPTFEQMTLSAQIESVKYVADEIEAGREIILMGSSLGGLLATIASEKLSQYRITKLILLAPAFSIKARWRDLIGQEGMIQWKETGVKSYFHYGAGKELNLGYTFIEDLEVIETENLKVNVPTLIFHGINDTSVPIDLSRKFSLSNGDWVQLNELDDGHELIESMNTMWQDVERFLHAAAR
jgi:predicted esterase YcpF (UPF0227 family)